MEAHPHFPARLHFGYIPMLGSVSQLPWQLGQRDGFLNFSGLNSKPHFRQMLGWTAGLWSVCFRLKRRCSKSFSTCPTGSPTARAIWGKVIGFSLKSSSNFFRNIKRVKTNHPSLQHAVDGRKFNRRQRRKQGGQRNSELSLPSLCYLLFKKGALLFFRFSFPSPFNFRLPF